MRLYFLHCFHFLYSDSDSLNLSRVNNQNDPSHQRAFGRVEWVVAAFYIGLSIRMCEINLSDENTT